MSKLLKTPSTRSKIGRTHSKSVRWEKTGSEQKTAPRKRLPFALTPRFFLFLLIWYAGRVFTQALHSPLSAIFYVFLFLFPLFSLIYVFIIRFAVRVYLGAGKGEGEKLQPIDFDMRIVNDLPLPLSFIEADMKVPDEKRVRCSIKRFRMMLLPHGYCDLAQNLVFPYRGEYEIGVSDIYIYDYFRLFRLRKRVETYMKVYIYPRTVTLEESHRFASSDVDTENVKHVLGSDRAELSDLRSYIPGDRMKNIHWKLSAKSEDLMVKEYSHYAGNTVYLFADLAQVHSAKYAVDEGWVYEDDVNEYVADGVVEASVALVRWALKAGHRCEILWYDRRAAGGVYRFAMEARDEFDRFFRPLATAGIAPSSCTLAKLTELVESDRQGASYLFVTGNLNQETANGVSRMATRAGGEHVALYNVSPESRITQPEQKKRYQDAFRRNSRYLQSRGVLVTEPEYLAETASELP